MIKAVIFDFDGTIIDTNTLIFEGLQYLAQRYRGEKLPMDILKGLSGKPLDMQLEAIHPDKVSVMEAQFQIWYKHNHNQQAKIFPGVGGLLQNLKNRGIELAIVTNNSSDVLAHGLEHLGIKHMFKHITTRDDVSETKPHPEGIYRALNALSLSPDEVIFVGDTENDLIAAYNAGVLSAFVSWSVLDHRKLTVIPDYILENAEDMVAIIEGREHLVA